MKTEWMKHLLGKVISCVIAAATCAQPAGQILYGFLFDALAGRAYSIFFTAAVISVGVGAYNRRIARRL